jgi:hypothetical protein
VAAGLLVAFVSIEHRHENPLVPLRIFSNRSLAASDATMLLLAAALFGVFFFCTLYLQQVLGYNALKTGVAYLPLSFTIIASSTIASGVVDRLTPKPVLVGGLLISTLGFVLFTRLQAHGDYAGRRGRGLGSGLGTAQHRPAGRRVAGPGRPVGRLDVAGHERAGRRIDAGRRADARLHRGVHGVGDPVRRGRRRGHGPAPGSPSRRGERPRRDRRDVLRPHPGRAVRRPPGARRRMGPPRAPRGGASAFLAPRAAVASRGWKSVLGLASTRRAKSAKSASFLP